MLIKNKNIIEIIDIDLCISLMNYNKLFFFYLFHLSIPVFLSMRIILIILLEIKISSYHCYFCHYKYQLFEINKLLLINNNDRLT